MPTNVIFDDGIIDMYTRDEAYQKFLTKQEFIDACIEAGLITGAVQGASIGALGYTLYYIYEAVKQQKDTGNASVTGQYTGSIPTGSSTANYQDAGQSIRPKVLEIECEWLEPNEANYGNYLYANKWLFPYRIRFNWNMYLINGENGKDLDCRCDKEGRGA